MDKVKVILALLMKHHFWVMGVVVILLSFIGWFLATSQLLADYRNEKSKIETKFEALQKIVRNDQQENDKWIEALEKETGELKVKVRKAWDQVYVEQKTNVLTWPKALGKDVAELERLGPNDEIPLAIRRRYSNYIKTEFPRLLAIVEAKDEHGGKSTVSDNPKDRAELKEKVIWSPANQATIYNRVEDMKPAPTSLQVRQAQEDLWVYQALLKIVAKLNEFAKGNYNAKVKEIQDLLIGVEAGKEFEEGMRPGRLFKLENPAAAAGTQQVAAGPGEAAPNPEAGRYVDEEGKPLTDPAAAPPEFKRMPVYMRLVMDQREIGRLLVECANSPLPVEVRRLHVRTKQSGKSSQTQVQQQPMSEKELNSYDMVVELEGLIYIFNPPDATKLGEVAAAAGAAPAAVQPPAVDGNAAPAADQPAGEAKAPAEPKKPAEPGEAEPAAAPEEPAAGTEEAEAGGDESAMPAEGAEMEAPAEAK